MLSLNDSRRRLVYGVAVVLALVFTWRDLAPPKLIPENRAGGPQAPEMPREAAISPHGDNPSVDLQGLTPRRFAAPVGDPFGAVSRREPEAEKAEREALAPPPAPQTPPLPFSFMGKLIDPHTTFVFLVNGDRNHAVKAGDTIDGVYRVEEIGEETLTLAYLPLNTRQSLAIGSPVRPDERAPAESDIPPPLRASAPPTHDPTRLVWRAPSAARIGDEFTVEVGLPAGPQARAGTVELVYDPLILAVLGGAASVASPSPTSRRAAVEIIGPGYRGGEPTPSEVRFRVISGTPTKTEIRLDKLFAKTASGEPLAIASPAPHLIAISRTSEPESRGD